MQNGYNALQELGDQMTIKKLIPVLTLCLLAGLLNAQQEDVDKAEQQMKAAQEKSDWAGVVQSAAALNAAIAKALATPRSESMTDEFYKNLQDRLKAQRVQAEYASLDAVNKETDPAKRVKMLEQFTTAFEGGDYAKRALPTLAGAYQQTGDNAKAVATAQRVLQTDPDNEGMHLMLADSDLAKNQLPSAVEHAQATLKILGSKKKPDGYRDDQWSAYTNTINGTAHWIAGRALVLQGKNEAAIPELKAASDLMTGPMSGTALYNLGFAYAKLRRAADARLVLAKAAAIPGPDQKLAKDLLAAQTPSTTTKKP
jgi:tetratricopeptide (TPR) repeat protein